MRHSSKALMTTDCVALVNLNVLGLKNAMCTWCGPSDHLQPPTETRLPTFRKVRSPKCRVGASAAGCSHCRTDWTSACASGWLSLPSPGEAWRRTSYYSRSSRHAQTVHKHKRSQHRPLIYIYIYIYIFNISFVPYLLSTWSHVSHL